MGHRTRQLSELQSKILELALPRLIANEDQIEIKWKGESEDFLVVKLTAHQIFVYSDAFQFIGKDLDVRVEEADIGSVKDGVAKFLECLNRLPSWSDAGTL